MYEKELDPRSSQWAAVGMQLRQLRKARGRTQVEVGRATSYSGAFIGYLERGERPMPHRFAVAVDSFLETGGVLELMWWQAHHSALIEGFPEFASLEEKATLIRYFELKLIPGLLQTEAYASAREADTVRRGNIGENEAAERVAFRMARQLLLERTPAPRFHAILEESCLHRTVGDASIMAGQLRHLEIMARRPNITIQVLPTDRGSCTPFSTAVKLLTLADRTLVGYTENHQRGFLEREEETVAVWGEYYDQLMVEALSPADSMSLIHDVRRGLVNETDRIVLSGASWCKSSYSEGGGECVEVAVNLPGVVPVRDSKDPAGPALVFPRAAWSSFVGAVGRGELPGC